MGLNEGRRTDSIFPQYLEKAGLGSAPGQLWL